MDEQAFRTWLKAKGHAPNTVSTRMADAKRVERHYGDLDAAYDGDRFAAILSDLAYSTADKAAGKPNRSRLEIDGDVYNGLASYRSALAAYARSREAMAGEGSVVTANLTRQSVLDAITRCDGYSSPQEFIQALEGLGQPKQYWLLHEGRRYPSKAIVRDALLSLNSHAKPGGGQCKAILEALDFVVIDWPAFERLRTTFLSRMKDFHSFRPKSGGYWDTERRYKDELISEVGAIASSDVDDATAGEQIYRKLSIGRQGLPLAWRTLAEVKEAAPELRRRFYETVGQLARSRADAVDAVTKAARSFEQLRSDGVAGLRAGEVLGTSITVIGTMRPDEASWFKISRIREMGQVLFGRRLFGRERFEPADFEEFRQLMRSLFELMANELNWNPADLFDVQGFVWVALDKNWDGEDGEEDVPVPVEELDPDASYWFVGASYGRTDDQTERFLAEGIWDIDSPSDRHRAQVMSMRTGQRIAIKATFVQKNDLPFDASGRRVSVMRIKARGTISAVSTDGETVAVEWEQGFSPRDWYFYTYQPTIWEVLPNKEMNRRLIRFAFEDEPQDIRWFRGNLPRWHEDAAPAVDEEDEPAAPFAPPTNLILYGPPGTGKTFTVMSEAVRLADELAPDDPLLAADRRTELKQRYDDLTELGRIGFVTFHQSISYEEFVEGLRPVQAEGAAGFSLRPRAGILCRMAEDARLSAEHHVLVIDEINRANISKVFGELITLIEADKRIGGDNAIRVILPYSLLPFGIPSNLHIVGTMNTADRSIALLDTALRRRFSFRELMPRPDLLEEASARTGVDLVALLRTINERIEYLFDREHQIGHAYFMGCDTRADVDAVMRDKVIPLLQEYFYEDWSKVALVLGDSDGGGRFLDRVQLKPPQGLGTDDYAEPRYRWSVREDFGEGAYSQFA